MPDRNRTFGHRADLTASEALLAAKEIDYDAAILDINLGDGMAYPVADIVVGARRSVHLRYRLRG